MSLTSQPSIQIQEPPPRLKLGWVEASCMMVKIAMLCWCLDSEWSSESSKDSPFVSWSVDQLIRFALFDRQYCHTQSWYYDAWFVALHQKNMRNALHLLNQVQPCYSHLGKKVYLNAVKEKDNLGHYESMIIRSDFKSTPPSSTGFILVFPCVCQLTLRISRTIYHGFESTSEPFSGRW